MLIGVKGTTYSESRISASYAQIDRGAESRGYFSLLNPADVNRDGIVDSADIVAVIKAM